MWQIPYKTSIGLKYTLVTHYDREDHTEGLYDDDGKGEKDEDGNVDATTLLSEGQIRTSY